MIDVKVFFFIFFTSFFLGGGGGVYLGVGEINLSHLDACSLLGWAFSEYDSP